MKHARGLLHRIHTPIGGILFIALLLRIIGLDYGLPLWLVGDEPSFIFGSLKMIQIKTLLPALHDEVFRGVFYYTPYISYLYLLPFGLILAIKFFLFSGPLAQFTDFMITDLSYFFIAARLVSVMLGTATVYLVYAAAGHLFRTPRIQYLAALLLAVNILHVLFSHWGRHWVAATFVFALVLYVLTRPDWQNSKRYVLASLIAGIGAGVSAQVVLVTVFIALWFFFHDRLSFVREVRRAWVWKSVGVFVLLAAVAYFVWPRGFYVVHKAPVSLQESKTIAGLLDSYWFYFSDIFEREPVFFLLVVVGFAYAARGARRFFWPLLIFSFFYLAMFYYLFVNVSRFVLLLYPGWVIAAAYGFDRLLSVSERKRPVCAHIMSIGLFSLIALPTLLMVILLDRGDTRTLARETIFRTVPAGEKVMVLAPLMRLPATRAAVEEKRGLQVDAVRQIDLAEERLPDAFIGRRYHALNLNEVASSTFYAEIVEYAQREKYRYIVLDPYFAADKGADAAKIAEHGTLLFEIPGFINDDPKADVPTDGSGLGWRKLWQSFSRHLGPDIRMYQFSS